LKNGGTALTLKHTLRGFPGFFWQQSLTLFLRGGSWAGAETGMSPGVSEPG
jgi:hypothetical protein